jgi:hypothetical protein
MGTFEIFMLIVAVFTAALGFGFSRGKNSVKDVKERIRQSREARKQSTAYQK